MGRKRSPEHDFICSRCLCPCDRWGDKHLGGGQNRKACAKALPVLRSEHEQMMTDFARDAAAAIRNRLTR